MTKSRSAPNTPSTKPKVIKAERHLAIATYSGPLPDPATFEAYDHTTPGAGERILAMAEKLSDMGKPVWIRHVLVPERSDRDDYLHRLADFIHTLKNVERVEVLPYHTLGVFKWENLGIPYQLEGINPPSAERIKNAEEILAFRK